MSAWSQRGCPTLLSLVLPWPARVSHILFPHTLSQKPSCPPTMAIAPNLAAAPLLDVATRGVSQKKQRTEKQLTDKGEGQGEEGGVPGGRRKRRKKLACATPEVADAAEMDVASTQNEASSPRPCSRPFSC